MNNIYDTTVFSSTLLHDITTQNGMVESKQIDIQLMYLSVKPQWTDIFVLDTYKRLSC